MPILVMLFCSWEGLLPDAGKLTKCGFVVFFPGLFLVYRLRRNCLRLGRGEIFETKHIFNFISR